MCLSVISNEMSVGWRCFVLTLTSIHKTTSGGPRNKSCFRTVHEQQNRHFLPHFSLGMVQMHLTVPTQQNRPVLSS